MRKIDSRSGDVSTQFTAETREGQGDPHKVGDDGLDIPAEVVIVMFVVFRTVLVADCQWRAWVVNQGRWDLT